MNVSQFDRRLRLYLIEGKYSTRFGPRREDSRDGDADRESIDGAAKEKQLPQRFSFDERHGTRSLSSTTSSTAL
jgi:hypothetical protein